MCERNFETTLNSMEFEEGTISLIETKVFIENRVAYGLTTYHIKIENFESKENFRNELGNPSNVTNLFFQEVGRATWMWGWTPKN